MSYRTTRTVRFDGQEYPEGSPIEFGEERDDVRRELLAIEAIEVPPDETEGDRDDRRRALLGELAVLSAAGVCLVTIDGDGNAKVQDYDPTTDPLASGDPTVVRRHYLDALRDLDDLTYLGFDNSAAADLGGLVLLSMDAETGIITSVTARSAAPIGVEVVDAPVAGGGAAEQLPGAIDDDGSPIPPVVPPTGGQAAGDVVIEPATDNALGRMTKDQLLDEARRVGAAIDANPTKAELVAAIVAKRVAA